VCVAVTHASRRTLHKTNDQLGRGVRVVYARTVLTYRSFIFGRAAVSRGEVTVAAAARAVSSEHSQGRHSMKTTISAASVAACS
jgi:hypothetical protein